MNDTRSDPTQSLSGPAVIAIVVALGTLSQGFRHQSGVLGKLKLFLPFYMAPEENGAVGELTPDAFREGGFREQPAYCMQERKREDVRI